MGSEGRRVNDFQVEGYAVSDDRCREAFEAWFKTRGVWPALTFLEVWQAAVAWVRDHDAKQHAESVARILDERK